MPTLSTMNSSTPPRSTVLSLIAALCIVASACASSPSDPAAFADEPEFGDSIDEFFDASEPVAFASAPPPEGFNEITWEDLIPPGSSGAEISALFDERIAAVEPGSPEADEVFAELQAAYASQPADPGLAGEDIVLAGFIAPLTYSGELITEFLLVPYFGACIHVPAPPPNQTVMVTLAEGEGVPIDDSWGAIWVAGTMTLDTADTDLATAAYSISSAQSGIYNDY